MTFDEFYTAYREQEALNGTKLDFNGIIQPTAPVTDAEIRVLYDRLVSEQATGLTHSGEIIGGPHVLDLKGIGR